MISVVLPCHNAAATIASAIDSIIAQTHHDWELIIVEDGSTDQSLERIESIARNDNRIRVLTPGRVGLVRALQIGCAAARGEFIARMDADDISLPGRFAAQLQSLAQNSDHALCGTNVEMFGSYVGSGRIEYRDWLNGIHTHDDILRNLFIECPIAHPTFLMRRDAYIQVGGYQETGWPEDYDLVMRMVHSGFKMHNVPQVLLQWRESRIRHSRTSPRYSAESFCSIKRHYLLQTHLAGNRPFLQWGAGAVGKKWLREWTDHKPMLAIDVHPRKSGARIHGVRVITPDEMPPLNGALVIIAVGAPGARAIIRNQLSNLGYLETKDFLFVA